MIEIKNNIAYVFENQEEASWIYNILTANGYKFDHGYMKDNYIPDLHITNFIAVDNSPSSRKRLYHNHTTSSSYNNTKKVLVKDLMRVSEKEQALEEALKIIYHD